MEQVEWDDVQAIVLNGFKAHPHSVHVPLRIRDTAAVKNWIGKNLDRVCSVADLSTPDDRYSGTAKKSLSTPIQIAFSFEGLRLLGVPVEALETFSDPFIEGMAPEPPKGRAVSRRAGLLGDEGSNHPGHWRWGGSVDNRPHALLILYAGERDLAVRELTALSANGTGWTGIDGAAVETWLSDREHFGFNDNVSQPYIAGTRHADALGDREARFHRVAAGEFLLGYVNERGAVWNVPTVDDNCPESDLLPNSPGGRRALGRNGSYLVARQLRQHVSVFDELAGKLGEACSESANPDDNRCAAAERLVGRRADGTPLMPISFPETINGFGFAETDSDGLFCPVGSHIRRTNPRDSLDPDIDLALKLANRHRILRRGRLYGRLSHPGDVPFGRKEDGEDRGIFFVALVADIAGQFEFIQDNWSNNRSFGGLSGSVDPLLANDATTLTLQARPAPFVSEGKQVVTVRGGEYFFLPGLGALDFLSKLPDRKDFQRRTAMPHTEETGP